MFKAKVTGNPQPTVSWERGRGCPLSDAAKCFCDSNNNQFMLKVWPLFTPYFKYKVLGCDRHHRPLLLLNPDRSSIGGMKYYTLQKNRTVQWVEQPNSIKEEGLERKLLENDFWGRGQWMMLGGFSASSVLLWISNQPDAVLKHSVPGRTWSEV